MDFISVLSIFVFAAQASPASATLLPIWKMEALSGFTEKSGRVGEVVAQARMLPASLFVLEQDFLDAGGKVAAAAGTELVGLRSELRVACAIFPPKLSGGAALMAMGADRHLCLIDENGDGAFDRYFRKQYHEAGFFNLPVKLPSTLKSGAGGGYRAANPQTMSRPLIWSITQGICKARARTCTVNASLSVPGFDGRSGGRFVVKYRRQYVLDVSKGSAALDFLGSRFVVQPVGEGARYALQRNFDDTPFPLF